jgi:hypothetical protein
MKHFGESYDIVKQSLIRWLAPFGRWSVHPMFTEAPKQADAIAFATFLDAQLLSSVALTANTDRSTYFACTTASENLFLDPNKGLRLENVSGKRAPQFIFASELISLVQRTEKGLTLV